MESFFKSIMHWKLTNNRKLKNEIPKQTNPKQIENFQNHIRTSMLDYNNQKFVLIELVIKFFTKEKLCNKNFLNKIPYQTFHNFSINASVCSTYLLNSFLTTTVEYDFRF